MVERVLVVSKVVLLDERRRGSGVRSGGHRCWWLYIVRKM
jgi:hypothetical protein